MKITNENALFLLALLLALGIRMFGLGAYPLQENEAHSALHALTLMQAGQSETSLGQEDSQPAYQALTWLAFEILGDQNLVARLWPALAGALLVFVPSLFRSLLGRPAALLLAFILALSPGLVAVSRQADGRMMTLAFALTALGLAFQSRLGWAGVFLGLALLSGPAAIPGLVGLILTYAIGKAFLKLRIARGLQDEILVDPLPAYSTGFLREGLIPAGVTIFAVGTLFFLHPQGLSSWASTFPAYFIGWFESSGIPALRLVFALLVYQPLAVVFGVSGALRGWWRADPLNQWLGLWSLVSLVLVLAYPARQVSDLVWTLVPMLTLAALEISQFLVFDRGDERIPLGMAALVLLMMIIFWLNLIGLGPLGPATQELILRLVVMAGILVLVALATVLVGLGWSWLSAGRGLVWGLCLALGIFGLSNVRDSVQREAGSLNLWFSTPASGEVGLFLDTVEELSTWQTGRADGLDIQVAVDSDTLRWSLRNYPAVTYIPESQVKFIRGNPSLLVTRQAQADLSLAADYRGQDFSWWAYPDWLGPLPPNVADWIAFRRSPQRQEQIILWARNDLFPGEIIPEVSEDQAPPQLISPEEFGP